MMYNFEFQKNVVPHPYVLFFWAYPENLVKIGLLVEAVETFCVRGWDGMGTGMAHIVII